MIEQTVTLAGARLTARGSGALWWAERRLICVADLHLGKSERIARRGGALLPPYETRETIARLAAEIAALDPATVLCLGDSFDDMASADALPEADRAALAALARGRDWIWLAGNHDPAPHGLDGGRAETLALGPLTFRHAALPEAEPGEISGHYHPKLRVALRTGTLSRPCFLCDRRRLILPAFGAYTGGLDLGSSPALAALIEPDARAILTGAPCVTLPAFRASA
ncbi:ligase-associated DNA damage response endonuclease PdeM [Amaricoccus solimangrovi]|uniref:Ligase-associated DNA damage response endonuclease PdeM n=1 Tax=Amaricoccus solimangrovi TaxID=2589815 RepID=A0A501X1D4_9RHOB|nr:ligase-associated DNA damage response endonuclease PdeM [Amaricoccus solimangrovi]TPE53796.1 ligase-associated DNA damage response endonuclease PdeM [Amaricoccus solimangrovi]